MSLENIHDAPGKKPWAKGLQICLSLILYGSVVALPVLWMLDDRLPTFVQYWWQGREEDWLVGWRSWDKAVAQAAEQPPGSGDVAGILTDFHRDNPVQAQYVQDMLVRGSYALYPRRFWVAPEGTILNGGPDVINSHFKPTAQWLQDHGVHGVINPIPGPDGKIMTNILILVKDTQK